MGRPLKDHRRHGRWRLGIAPACLLLAYAAGALAQVDCSRGSPADAALNAASEATLVWAPFRRPEIGWATYVPLVSREIATTCPASSPGFAAALSRWRRAHGLGDSGVMDAPTFAALQEIWEARRPFVRASHVACPPPPPAASLALAPAAESWGGKPAPLLPAVLDAYVRMLAVARADVPEVAADRRIMSIFSAFRSPDSDDARCARDNDCQGVTRAACSAHRTGAALDLFLGVAPGHAVDSADDVNRRAITQGAAYLWMVRNAGRFGFVNYPFEPWHWEWTGRESE